MIFLNTWAFSPPRQNSSLSFRENHTEHELAVHKTCGQSLAALFCLPPSETPQAGPVWRGLSQSTCLSLLTVLTETLGWSQAYTPSHGQEPEAQEQDGPPSQTYQTETRDFSVSTDAWLHL